ncbi:MAG TPA: YigZ family protein [Flavitalea sp.]|nr:YigZ family protein [Flavitalea sp.]
MQEHFLTISKSSSAEFRDRGSRFIAFAYPVSTVTEFKTIRTALKVEHSKATHHCFAYRIGESGNEFRVSDDREPAGTAGRPILGQIDSRALTNIAVIVVRYFGGTLLGVPGLINAYKTSAALALQITPVIKNAVTIPFSLLFPYTALNDILRVIKKYDVTIASQELQLFSSMVVNIPMALVENIMSEFKNQSEVEIKKV